MDTSSDIRSIAGQFLNKVRKSGPENIMALCPFHVKADGSEEKNPSFAMSLTNGLWFCHSCQSSGNLFTFLRDIGLSRQQIDLHYRITIDAASKNIPPKLDPLNTSLVSANPIEEGVLGIFDNCPLSLLEDGFQEETLRHFGVGFDMHHTRITYPIRDLAGNLVGISGRAMVDVWPKYKIYEKEYEIFGLPARINWDKSSCLWNANDVYPQLFFQNNPSYIVIVEGFKACMWLWQCGIKNVVALVGTYLSPQHQWILERLGAPVYLFLDNNYPGQKGIRKAGDKLTRSLRVNVIEYPERLMDEDDAQPDSLTPEEVMAQWHTAASYFTWLTT
jgi:DNA primase